MSLSQSYRRACFVFSVFWLLELGATLVISLVEIPAAYFGFVLNILVEKTVVLWLPWFVLAAIPLQVLQYCPLTGRVSKDLVVHLGSGIFVSLLHAGVVFRLASFSNPADSGEAPQAFFAGLLGTGSGQGIFLFDLIVYGTIVAVLLIAELRSQLQQQSNDSTRLARNLSDSKLETLKMQLNPHFLFNTLNSISVLVEKKDNQSALKMISELCGFLRQTLNNSRMKWVSLSQEMAMIRDYVAIEKIRFGSRLSYYEECEPIALEGKIPPMLLQPLFENAIVHGLSEKPGPCRLHVECRVFDRYLIILITDNGEGFDMATDPGHKAGIGLANVKARLKEVYGDNMELMIEKNQPSGTRVRLKIPAYKDSQF